MMMIYYKLRAFLVTWLLRLLPRNSPLVFHGPDSALTLCDQMAALDYHKVLIVTDSFLATSGILDGIKQRLDSIAVNYSIYDGVLPDPGFDKVKEAQQLLTAENCQAIIAVGGGSVLDAAKMASMLHTNPGELDDFTGIQPFKKIGMPLFAIPTTAGTGSEITMVAVITDPDDHKKVMVVDSKMIATAIALDASLMKGLPAGITAATGMDALTHAVESFLATSSNEASEEHARAAVKLIFKYLLRAWQQGDDIEARDGMALAAFYAGSAFSKTSVGYVHGIAHQFGRLCGTPHGNANAMLLPEVLVAYGSCIYPQLAKLAVVAGLGKTGDDSEQLARSVIQAIFTLRADMQMPLQPQGLQATAIEGLIDEAIKETGSLYPVPRYLSRDELKAIVRPLVENNK